VSKSRLVSSLFVVAFCLAAAIASPAQTLTTLYTFDYYHGRRPSSPLVQGLNGNLYGATFYGGNSDDGTVYEITPSGTLTSLHSFCAQTDCTDGVNPGELILGRDGNFYGVTPIGGANSDPNDCPFGCGTVFKSTPGGSVTTLYNFCAQKGCADGFMPNGLVQGTDGNLYGTTNPYSQGFCPNCIGSIFKLTPQGVLTTLYNFCSQNNCADGQNPEPGLIQASNGNFYGTTLSGVIFEVTSAGKYSVLYTFKYGSSDPGPLVQGSNGNLYGVTNFGGAYHNGSVFRITLDGKFFNLYSFCRQSGCPDGYAPAGWLVQGTDGNLYGTTSAGGANTNTNDCPTGCGTIFSLSPAGTFTNLYNFCSLANCADGDGPGLGMIQGTDGKFYGNTGVNYYGPEGTIFSFDMGLGPYIEAQTNFGNVGRQIAILGNNLSSTTAVSFNGTSATFQILSDTLVRATVPAGATTGAIQLTNSSGPLSTKVPFIVR
jgi:uncharacterized repeat protein (TIGR03803 family)